MLAHRTVLRTLGLSAAFALAGCGDNVVGGDPSPDAGMNVGPGGYPAGPYGVEENQVLQNLTFAGFLTAAPSTDLLQGTYVDAVSLDDLRRITGYRYLILNVAAEWCTPCKMEAQVLPAKFSRWAERGGLVLGVLTENAQVEPATRERLEAWVRSYQTNYTMVHDPRGEIARVLAPATMPLNLFIDMESMTILRRRVGDDPQFFDYVDGRLGL